MRWFKRGVAFAALCLATATSAFAAGPVGTRSLVFDDPTTKRRLAVEVFFEATASAKVESFAARAPFRSIELARGATPAASPKRPLIVLSHGNWGTPFSQGWLARELVIAGYVVVSLTHLVQIRCHPVVEPGADAGTAGDRAIRFRSAIGRRHRTHQ